MCERKTRVENSWVIQYGGVFKMSKVPNWVLIVVGILTFAFGGFLLIGYALYRIFANKSKNEVVSNDWLKDKQSCQYKHFFENTGVAIDTEKK